MPNSKSDPNKPAATPARTRSSAAKAGTAKKPAAKAATPSAKASPARRSPARKPAAAAEIPAAAAVPLRETAKAALDKAAATPAPDMGAENADADKTEAVTLKKKELLSRVADLSGAKRKDVKPVLEAALRVLGEALSKGEELNLPPLGKVRVNRSKSDAGTDILTLRLRRDTGGKSEEKGGKEGLASEGEDD